MTDEGRHGAHAKTTRTSHCALARRLRGAGRFRAHRVRALARGHNLARLDQLFLVPLLAHEEADPGGDLLDTVADAEAESIDFEDDLLELGQRVCHSSQMIPVRASGVQWSDAPLA